MTIPFSGIFFFNFQGISPLFTELNKSPVGGLSVLADSLTGAKGLSGQQHTVYEAEGVGVGVGESVISES